jgi:hypothetical protein
MGGPTRREVPLQLEVPGIDEVMWARGDACFDVLVPTRSAAGGPLGLIRRTGYRIVLAARRDFRMLEEFVVETYRARCEAVVDLAIASCYARLTVQLEVSVDHAVVAVARERDLAGSGAHRARTLAIGCEAASAARGLARRRRGSRSRPRRRRWEPPTAVVTIGRPAAMASARRAASLGLRGQREHVERVTSRARPSGVRSYDHAGRERRELLRRPRALRRPRRSRAARSTTTAEPSHARAASDSVFVEPADGADHQASPSPSSTRAAARASDPGHAIEPDAVRDRSRAIGMSRCWRACAAVVGDGDERMRELAAARRSSRFGRSAGFLPCLVWIAAAPTSRAAGTP